MAPSGAQWRLVAPSGAQWQKSAAIGGGRRENFFADVNEFKDGNYIIRHDYVSIEEA